MNFPSDMVQLKERDCLVIGMALREFVELNEGTSDAECAERLGKGFFAFGWEYRGAYWEKMKTDLEKELKGGAN